MKKFSSLNFRHGFTLIELLVVISVFVVITTIILGVLVTVFRSTQNSDSLIEVKQNGDYVMTQIVTNLRFAQSLDDPNPAGGSAPACSPSGISVSTISITTIKQAHITISCPSNSNPPNYIDFNGTQLTNSKSVVVKSCNFTCTHTIGGPPTIGIFYTLSKVNSKGLLEGNAKIPFESSVTLRNLGG